MPRLDCGEVHHSRWVSFGAAGAARVKTPVTSPTRASLPCLPADWAETNCRGYRRVMQNPVKPRNPEEGESPEGSRRRLFNLPQGRRFRASPGRNRAWIDDGRESRRTSTVAIRRESPSWQPVPKRRRGEGSATGRHMVQRVASRPSMHMLKADETFPLAGFEAQVRRRQLCGRIGSRLEWNLPHPVA